MSSEDIERIKQEGACEALEKHVGTLVNQARQLLSSAMGESFSELFLKNIGDAQDKIQLAIDHYIEWEKIKPKKSRRRSRTGD